MRTALLALALTASPSVALADIAPPAPSDLSCPRGSIGRVHQGEGRGYTTSCEPSECASDDDCDGGRVCSTDEIGLCVEQVAGADSESVPSARRRGCESDGTCLNVDSICETARRCVSADARTLPDTGEPPVAPDPAAEPSEEESAPAQDTSDAGCGCRAVTGGPARGPAGVAFVGVLALAWSRRRGAG